LGFAHAPSHGWRARASHHARSPGRADGECGGAIDRVHAPGCLQSLRIRAGLTAMNGFFVMTLAVALSMMLIPVAQRLAPKLGMVDMPDPRKVHNAPVPRVGGWGITIGSLVPLVLVFQSDPLLQSFAAGGLILFAFGLWDDAKQVSHWIKFVGQ